MTGTKRSPADNVVFELPLWYSGKNINQTLEEGCEDAEEGQSCLWGHRINLHAVCGYATHLHSQPML